MSTKETVTIDDAMLVKLRALIDLMRSQSPPSEAEARERRRAYMNHALAAMASKGLNYGEATGFRGTAVMSRDYDEFRRHIREIDNDFGEQLRIVTDGVAHYLENGVGPAPYYAWRIGVILRRSKLYDLEAEFLEAFSALSAAFTGGRFTDIAKRAVVARRLAEGGPRTSRPAKRTRHPAGLTGLARQCDELGWQLEAISAEKDVVGNWLWARRHFDKPEELVLARLQEHGEQGCWCRGGTMALLIKAAGLDALTRFNPFQARDDAIRRYLSAQCLVLKDKRSDIVAAIAKAPRAQVEQHARDICADSFVNSTHPRVTPAFMLHVWDAVGPHVLARVADRFFENPDLVSGWPDLTMVGPTGVRFVEVMTTGRLQGSKLRFARDVAQPLGLACAAIQVTQLG